MVDAIGIRRLVELAQRQDEQGLCLTIYLPTHRTGRERKEDTLRLKNLLKRAEQLLTERQLNSRQIRSFLRPVESLLEDSSFWEEQADGLVLFVTADACEPYRLPQKFSESVTLAEQFELTPLIPFVQHNGRFYLLAASQNKLRLFQGDRWSLHPVTIPDMPERMTDTMRDDDPDESLQNYSFRQGSGGVHGDQKSVYHGNQELPGKDEILKYFRVASDTMQPVLNENGLPLVFAGVEYLFPLFKEASDYSRLLPTSVTGNPDGWDEATLHQHAWPLVESYYSGHMQDLSARYQRGFSAGLAIHDLNEINSAAVAGRVEALFVADQNGHASAATQPVNAAVIHTLRTRGEVFLLPSEQMPEQQPIAALLRYTQPAPATAQAGAES